MSQQDLCGDQSVLFKQGFIGADQAHLANGGRRLQFMQGMRSARPSKPTHPLRYRA